MRHRFPFNVHSTRTGTHKAFASAATFASSRWNVLLSRRCLFRNGVLQAYHLSSVRRRCDDTRKRYDTGMSKKDDYMQPVGQIIFFFF